MKAMRRFWEKLSWVTVFVFVLTIVGAGVGWTAYTGNKAVTVGGRATYDIYDEDAMDSEDAYGLATQQSIKRLVQTPPYLVIDTEAEAELGSGNSEYTVWLIDTVNYAGHTDSELTGVSVYLPSGTTELDGFILRLADISDAGTTDVILVPANDSINSSGVTDHLAAISGATYTVNSNTGRLYDALDAQHETLALVYRWLLPSGGTWYQLGRYGS